MKVNPTQVRDLLGHPVHCVTCNCKRGDLYRLSAAALFAPPRSLQLFMSRLVFIGALFDRSLQAPNHTGITEPREAARNSPLFLIAGARARMAESCNLHEAPSPPPPRKHLVEGW